MIALMRSATSTSLTGLKREGSEPVALKGPVRGESELLGRSLSRSTSMTNLGDAKANKKALVEAQLKEAISTLRKPQRGTVSQQIVNATERRTQTGLSAKSKPSKTARLSLTQLTCNPEAKKPGRSSLGASIVKATPTNNRFRDVFAPKSESMADVPLLSTEEVIPPSSLPSRIPSTGLRMGRRDMFRNSPSPALDRIDNTPSKGTRFQDRLENDDPVPWSPLMERRKESSDNVIVPGSAVKGQRTITEFTSPRDEGVFTTPVKPPAKVFVENTPTQALPAVSAVKPLSIYQKLGWDDDLDDL